MATCYRCGRPISSTDFKLRRKVKTGESLRRKYPNPQIQSLTITYGTRLVCMRCAVAIDREAARKELVMYVELGIALLLAFALLFFHFFG